MSTYLFLFRELLGAIRTRSALLLVLSSLLLFAGLASLAVLLLSGTAPTPAAATGLAGDEAILFLSPRLSAEAVNALYLDMRERDDVEQVNFRFAQEINPGDTGGRLFLRAASAAALTDLLDEVALLDGVTTVERGEDRPAPRNGFSLPIAVRIALLCCVVLTIAASFLLARSAFRILLRAFASEVRLLRLTGVSERMIHPPVIGLGVLIGLLTGLIILVGIALYYFASGGDAGSLAMAASDAAEPGRLFGAGVVSLLLGLLLGGLIGLLSASLLGSREFSPLP